MASFSRMQRWGTSFSFGRSTLVLTLGLVAAATRPAAANAPPVADPGPSRYVGDDPVTLDGTASYDPDPGTVLSYAWTQIAGPTVILSNADTPTPTLDATPTSRLGSAIVQLTVEDDHEATDTAQVTVTITPKITVPSVLVLENPPFDPGKPTFVYFSGGDCTWGGAPWNGGALWTDAVNVVSFTPYGPPYVQHGDILMAYLSNLAPNYDQPIQTAGFSTGGQPAIECAMRMNILYADPRYAVNHVTYFDAACRDYTTNNATYVNNPVPGETAWIENFHAQGRVPQQYAVNIAIPGGHSDPYQYYEDSIDPAKFNTGLFNDGLVACAAFTFVWEHGANYWIDGASAAHYYFQWSGEPLGPGSMTLFDPQRPGRLPEPLTLTGPGDGAVVSRLGTTLGSDPSVNTVTYAVRFGQSPDSLPVVATSATPPQYDTGPLLPGQTYYWSIDATEAYGMTYRAPVRSFEIGPIPADLDNDGDVDMTDYLKFVSCYNGPNAPPAQPDCDAADFDTDGDADLLDYSHFLDCYNGPNNPPRSPA
jgi:hypothetical protein